MTKVDFEAESGPLTRNALLPVRVSCVNSLLPLLGIFYLTVHKMFVSSVGALNSHNKQSWVHVPRAWPQKDKPVEPKKDDDNTPGVTPGVRRSGPTGGGEDADPLAELRKEILG